MRSVFLAGRRCACLAVAAVVFSSFFHPATVLGQPTTGSRVRGPSGGVTDGTVAAFDGTTGRLIKALPDPAACPASQFCNDTDASGACICAVIDPEAVSAMGVKADTNPLNHDKATLALSIANTYWVTTDGSDSGGSNLSCSLTSPCATIQQAIYAAAAASPPVSASNKALVRVRAGNYTEKNIKFVDQDGYTPIEGVRVQGDGSVTRVKETLGANDAIFDMTGSSANSLVDMSVTGDVGSSGAGIWSRGGANTNGFTRIFSNATTSSTIYSAFRLEGTSNLLNGFTDVEPFNLIGSRGRLVDMHFGRSAVGMCDTGDYDGACLDALDCPNGTCATNSADWNWFSVFSQSNGVTNSIEPVKTCQGGTTSLTGTVEVQPTSTCSTSTCSLFASSVSCSTNADCQTAMLGTSTLFTTEVVRGHLLRRTSNSAFRMVRNIDSATLLHTSRAFATSGTSLAMSMTDDGWPCRTSSDCDAGVGTCYEGVCKNDNTIGCTFANESTDCTTPSNDRCVVGTDFNLLMDDNSNQTGPGGGDCSDDIEVGCTDNADCATCTTNADCSFGGICDGTNCSCDGYALRVRGPDMIVRVRKDYYDCNLSNFICTNPRNQIAVLDGATIEQENVAYNDTLVNATSGGTIVPVGSGDFTGIRLLPRAANGTPRQGEMWWDSTANAPNWYDGANTHEPLTGTVLATQGGTGIAGNFTIGSIFYPDTVNTWAQLAPGTAGESLLTQGPSAAPVFGPIDLSLGAATTGTLGTGSGGTGITATPTNNDVFVTQGSSTPLWLSLGGNDVLGRTNGGSVGTIHAGSNEVLRSNGSGVLGFGAINSAHVASADKSGTGDFVLAVNPVITTGTVTADPTAALGISSKQYVDNTVTKNQIVLIGDYPTGHNVETTPRYYTITGNQVNTNSAFMRNPAPASITCTAIYAALNGSIPLSGTTVQYCIQDLTGTTGSLCCSIVGDGATKTCSTTGGSLSIAAGDFISWSAVITAGGTLSGQSNRWSALCDID